MDNLLLLLLDTINEILAAAIVVVAVSMLLYNITRNYRDRVARTSGAVLACVTVVYIGDTFLSLEPNGSIVEIVHRLQWIGIAFIPAALFHLSDALLDTTGLPSRGRRKRVARILYAISTVFLLLATFTDVLVHPVTNGTQTSLRAGPLFVIYLAYFLTGCAVAFNNVDRARRRCLTRSTKRRMAYIQLALLTPAIGLFPFSVYLNPGEEFSLGALILVNIANLGVILMLLFIAYPLSFFGSRIPDRVVKTELLRFMLRGPATGMLILGVIIFTRRATDILGLPGNQFMPFAVVAVVLFWQWMVDLWLPWLEKRLIYKNEDDDQLAKIQTLNRHLLTRTDLLQHVEAILEASCDYLRVNRAFVVSVNDASKSEIVRFVGLDTMHPDDIEAMVEHFLDVDDDDLLSDEQPRIWNSYWLLPLRSRRTGALTENNEESGPHNLIGIMGIEARSSTVQLTEDEQDRLQTLQRRAARTLDDILLQSEIYAALEGLLPQIATARERVAEIEFRPGYTRKLPSGLPNRDLIIEQVGAALRHYYGGPGLTNSRLLELKVVQNVLAENDNNPTRALRAVLDDAIENQRPEGEQDYKAQEWMLYNILHLRFIKKRRVRDTARRLFISDANLYRKQNLAFEAVADTLLQMEQRLLEGEPEDAQTAGKVAPSKEEDETSRAPHNTTV